MTTADLRFQRLIFFTDAVFAIAITLLVVDLRPPDVPAAGYEAALRAYLAQPAPFIATAIGFVVVGSALVVEVLYQPPFWLHAPFFTAALAEHDPNRTSVIAYAGCQVVAGLAQLGLWAVALRGRHLLVQGVTPRRERYVTIQLVRAPAAFAISIPVTMLLGPIPGMVSWGAIIVAAALIARAFPDLPRDPDQAEALRAA